MYNKINISNYILKPLENKNKVSIFLSMTTCKRYDLFEKTVNSILSQWLDCNKIDYWFVVDDNSNNDDKNKIVWVTLLDGSTKKIGIGWLIVDNLK